VIQKLLAPLDGSNDSDVALDVAAELDRVRRFMKLPSGLLSRPRVQAAGPAIIRIGRAAFRFSTIWAT
jgi:hypothetical protein